MIYAKDTFPFNYLNDASQYAPDRDTGILELSDIFGIILNVMLGVALAVSFISLILSGIKIITSRGDPKARTSANSALTNSIIALILTVGAFTIKIIIFNALGGDFGELRNETPNI